MSDDQLAVKFVVHLSRATSTIRMYGPDHPAVQRGASEAFEVVEDALARETQITFGRRDGQLIFQDKPVRENAEAASKFLDLLGDLEVETVTMDTGLGAEELAEFVKLVGVKLDGDKQEVRDKINALPHVATDAVTYLAVSAAKSEVIDRFDEQTLEKLSGLDSGQLENAVASVADQVNEVARVTRGSDPGLESSGANRRIVQTLGEATHQLVERSNLDVNHLGAHFLQLIDGLDPAVQRSLFGQEIQDASDLDNAGVQQRLELTLKAGVMANELRKGAVDDAQWQSRLETLLNSSQDVVGLAESIASQVQLEDGQLDEASMSRLLRLIQTQAKPEVLGGGELVLIADPDPEMVEQYNSILERSGLQLISANTGPTALRMIREMSPDCVVLDVPLPDLSGIDVVQALDQDGIDVPIIVYTATASYRNNPVIDARQRLKFLTKPFDANAFMQAIEELVIRGREQRLHEVLAARTVDPEQEKEDLAKARRVQAGLLPQTIPDLHGFEIGAYYNACRDVGGDYFDFFTLDEDHVGFLIADVAGKGISAAMVMCMARTVFHSLHAQTLSPRELMLKANEIVHRDLVHGMFLTVMYCVLNHRTGIVRCCSAGHNPALIYSEGQGLSTFTQPSGIALGLIGNEVFEDACEEFELSLDDGDMLILYTDGVVEATNPEREEFGEDRMTQLVNQSQDYSTQEILELMIAALKRHQGSAPQFDDVTLVGLRNVGEDYFDE